MTYWKSTDSKETKTYGAVKVFDIGRHRAGQRLYGGGGPQAPPCAGWRALPARRERGPHGEYGSNHYEVRQPCEQHYDLIRLDRVQLQTPYTSIARGLVKLVQEFYNVHRKEHCQALGIPEDDPDQEVPLIEIGLCFDATGAGRVFAELLWSEVRKRIDRDKPRLLWLPVVATGGAKATSSGWYLNVPKRELISSGIVCYQNGRLRVGKLKHRGVLEEELRSYRLKQSQLTGHDSYSPVRERQNDDLLFAVTLGCCAWKQAIKKQEYIAYPNEILFAR